MLNKDNAFAFLKTHLKTQNLLSHSLAVACIMERLADRFAPHEKEKWYLTGLLHDIDLDYVQNDFSQHGIKAMDLLSAEFSEPDALHAIQSHAGKREVKTLLDQCLWATDPLSGLIVAAALMHPGKSIKELPFASLKKRYNDKRFAAGAKREQISSCSAFNLELDQFLQLGLQAMAEQENLIFG